MTPRQPDVLTLDDTYKGIKNVGQFFESTTKHTDGRSHYANVLGTPLPLVSGTPFPTAPIDLLLFIGTAIVGLMARNG